MKIITKEYPESTDSVTKEFPQYENQGKTYELESITLSCEFYGNLIDA